MKSIIWGMVKGAWRLTGPTLVGVGMTALTASPYGLVAIPVLKGLSQGYKEFLKAQGKTLPGWFTVLPF